ARVESSSLAPRTLAPLCCDSLQGTAARSLPLRLGRGESLVRQRQLSCADRPGETAAEGGRDVPLHARLSPDRPAQENVACRDVFNEDRRFAQNDLLPTFISDHRKRGLGEYLPRLSEVAVRGEADFRSRDRPPL